MKNKTLFTILGILLLLAIALGAYWYVFLYNQNTEVQPTETPQNGFAPLSRPSTNKPTGTTTPETNTNQSTTTQPIIRIPTLRLLSNTPVGGYGASTTASTTIIHWVDRGRGNIYEARGNSLIVTTLPNTILPRMYASVWNKNATTFIGSMLGDSSSEPTTVYAELLLRATSTKKSGTSTPVMASTETSLTPFDLKGKNLPDNMIAYASSPKKDRIFMLLNEAGHGIGYISTFDGKNVTQLFTTPLTQVNIEWPEENTIAVTTKGAADQNGFLYFVNIKTGIWSKILGPLPGLSTRVSHDAKNVIVSVAGNIQNVLTSIYSVQQHKGNDAIIRTLADKCVWGNFYKDLVYCATPSQPVQATYPDDWYTGTVSSIDKIWQVNATTGEVHLVSSIVDQSDRLIDGFNLGLDSKDAFLFFMNKNDLSLWSLDLVAAH